MDISGISVERGSIDATLLELKGVEKTMKEALRVVCDAAAKKMETWAKENHPWQNRTGNAEQKLHGEGYWENDTNLTCAVMHCVDYGVWLELAHAKRFAVLEDAIESHKDELLAQYKKIVGD
jgi:hypothetical protein